MDLTVFVSRRDGLALPTALDVPSSLWALLRAFPGAGSPKKFPGPVHSFTKSANHDRHPCDFGGWIALLVDWIIGTI